MFRDLQNLKVQGRNLTQTNTSDDKRARSRTSGNKSTNVTVHKK